MYEWSAVWRFTVPRSKHAHRIHMCQMKSNKAWLDLNEWNLILTSKSSRHEVMQQSSVTPRSRDWAAGELGRWRLPLAPMLLHNRWWSLNPQPNRFREKMWFSWKFFIQKLQVAGSCGKFPLKKYIMYLVVFHFLALNKNMKIPKGGSEKNKEDMSCGNACVCIRRCDLWKRRLVNKHHQQSCCGRRRVCTYVVGGQVGMNDTCNFTFDLKKLDPTPPQPTPVLRSIKMCSCARIRHHLRSIKDVFMCKERQHLRSIKDVFMCKESHHPHPTHPNPTHPSSP